LAARYSKFLRGEALAVLLQASQALETLFGL
jgi:hypothetical protein